MLTTVAGISAALENEVNRLRESASSLTQQLLDAVAKAERAERDKSEATAAAASHEKLLQAEREAAATAREEWARLRGEMESALAEVQFGCQCFAGRHGPCDVAGGWYMHKLVNFV